MVDLALKSRGDSTGRAVLSEDELRTFREEGLVVPRARLSPAQLQNLQGLIAELDRKNPGLLDKPVVSPHVPSGFAADGREWMRFATQPLILDIIEQILGPDLILWGSALFYKRAQKAPFTIWHRDAAFFPIKPLEAVIVWVAAFDSVIENGCLRYIPGSHASRELGRHVMPADKTFTDSPALVEEDYDASKARDVEVSAGQIVIFDSHLVHGARANEGTRARAGYALRFMPSNSHYDREWAASDPARFAPGAANRPLFLVRGQDRCGLNKFAA